MANPFDQFDTAAPAKVASPSANPFDQFDAHAKAPAEADIHASKVESVKRGMTDPITGGAQLLTHILPERVVEAGNELNNWMAKYGLVSELPTKDQQGNPIKGAKSVDELIHKDEAEIQAKRAAAGRDGADWYRVAGSVASPANLAIAARAPQALSVGGRIASSALQGAESSVLAPVTTGDFASEKAKQVATGATVGAIVPGLTAATARIIKPITDKAVKALTDAGVSLTPGQILGGWFQRAEEAATSIPFIGDAIKGAQRRAITTFNSAAINDALKPIGDKVPKGLEGNEAIAYARKSLGDAYDNLLPKLKGDLHNAPPANALPSKSGDVKSSLMQELNNIRKMGEELPEQQQKDLNRIIDKEVVGKFTKDGKASGQTLKNIQETLNKEANNFASGDAYQRTLAGGIKEIGSSLRRMITDVNPDHAKELDAINKGYGSFKIAQKASSSVAAKDGVFTPAQYHNAVKAADKTKDKRAFSEGTARGQELSSAAKSRLSQTVPDSGTATRALMEAALLGGGAHAMGIPYAAGALAVPAAYSKPGTSLARLLLSARPEGAESLANSVRRSTPALTAGAVPLSQLISNTQNP